MDDADRLFKKKIINKDGENQRDERRCWLSGLNGVMRDEMRWVAEEGAVFSLRQCSRYDGAPSPLSRFAFL